MTVKETCLRTHLHTLQKWAGRKSRGPGVQAKNVGGSLSEEKCEEEEEPLPPCPSRAASCAGFQTP